MPELAEVEYFRRRWDDGIGQRIVRVELHREKRVFRGTDPGEIEKALRGAKLLGSATHGKQIAFPFSKGVWLGIHLGMSGKLRVEAADFAPRQHDHLALFQKRRTLLFSDPRTFGRVRVHVGKDMPKWWASLPPAMTSREFTATRLRHILQRRRRTPLKALLLIQEFFPGIGNWMADEILWQARLYPRVAAGALGDDAVRELWRVMRSVCRVALKTIGVSSSQPSPPPVDRAGCLRLELQRTSPSFNTADKPNGPVRNSETRCPQYLCTIVKEDETETTTRR